MRVRDRVVGRLGWFHPDQDGMAVVEELAERAPDTIRTWLAGELAASLDEPVPRPLVVPHELSASVAASRDVDVHRSCR